MRISSALRSVFARSWLILEPQEVVGCLFERPVGKVPRPGAANHDAGEYIDGRAAASERTG